MLYMSCSLSWSFSVPFDFMSFHFTVGSSQFYFIVIACSFILFYSISWYFVSFHFTSFHFMVMVMVMVSLSVSVSFDFMVSNFILWSFQCYFMLVHLIPLQSFHFMSFCFISCHAMSFHFMSKSCHAHTDLASRQGENPGEM